MEQFITDNLHIYGPWAVFFLVMLSGVGLSISEDLVIIPAGILVGRGTLDFWPVLIAAYSSVVLSDTLWFSICYRYGTPLLHKRWFKRMIHPRRLLEAKHQMEKRGAWMVVMARFIPGSRTTTITVAAMLHMKPWKFIAITAACVMLTAPLQVGAGMLIAHQIADYETAQVFKFAIGAAVAIVALVIVVRLYLRYRRSSKRAPRARVRWLKRFRAGRKTEADTSSEVSESQADADG